MTNDFNGRPPEGLDFAMDLNKLRDRMSDIQEKVGIISTRLSGNIEINNTEYLLSAGMLNDDTIGDISLAGDLSFDVFYGIPLSSEREVFANLLAKVRKGAFSSQSTIADPETLSWIFYENRRPTGIGWWNPDIYSSEKFSSALLG